LAEPSRNAGLLNHTRKWCPRPESHRQPDA